MRWCAAANPAEPLPHKRTAPLRMRRAPQEASTVLLASRARARFAMPTDRLHVVSCEHAILHKRKAAAEAAVDSSTLVCSGSRCSSP